MSILILAIISTTQENK
ncbi:MULTISPECIES: hypothetical protein [Enterobacteriaceae]|uniref:Uncharacterized protein n=1 Tax=Kosakonia sacchari TaxID=1158459 RepID=A0ABZ0MXT8_9ENTR|nr:MULTISPECIES: hypothetical protein [Enterobacteriaceae]MDV5354986.1 hypothetical protein [Enterobacter asburiae]WLI79012.1 hypothetical protein Q5705_10830 [Kosakonia sp. H02]MCL6743789.1 hypothetical protein [Kosakonia sp. R1.Fl]MCZ3384848.1 hypothetical protein [Kosakonia sp. SOY2]MDF7761466.1 hypothetical protein [Kosakonia cowanii]